MALTKIRMRRPGRLGLGDIVERAVHPIAVALRLPCLDKQTRELRPESPCGKRRDRLNKIGDKVVDKIKKLIPALALLCAVGASGQTNTNWVYIPYGHLDVATNWWTNVPPMTVVSNWQVIQAVNYNFLRVWDYWSNSTPKLSSNWWTGAQTYMSRVRLLDGVDGSGSWLSNLAVGVSYTNAANPEVLDAGTASLLVHTNASLVIAGFSGLTEARQHNLQVKYVNTGGTNIVVTGPPTCFYIGAASTNAMTIPTGKRGVWGFWIETDVETNCANAVQQ